jgi:Zn-dependent protease/predicted transcriptional regulator
MRRGWLVGRIRGVEVRVEPSLAILGVLITANLWTFYSSPSVFEIFSFRIRSVSPPLASGPALALALLTTFLFVSSILAHEVAHAIAFRARGIPVRGITLFMFGGFTMGASEADRPFDEFFFAAVGPATTAALGVLFLALHVAASSAGLHAYRAMFGYLAVLNLFMAAFNLLPGLPLDGGRVLMAILWRVTSSRSRATRMAARAGQVVALVISGWGIIELTTTGDLGGIWPLFIGWMLFSSSTAALFQSDRMRMMESATAADVMSPPPPTIPADLPLSLALERLTGREGEAFPVIDGGRVVGFISPRLVREARLGSQVRDAMAGTEAVAITNSKESMARVTDRIRDGRAHVALVVDDGRLVGVIEQEDLARFFRRDRRGRRPRRFGRGSPRPGSPPPRPDKPEGGPA